MNLYICIHTSKGITFMLLSVFGSLHIRSFTDHIWECVLCGRYSTVRFPHPFQYIIFKILKACRCGNLTARFLTRVQHEAYRILWGKGL